MTPSNDEAIRAKLAPMKTGTTEEDLAASIIVCNWVLSPNSAINTQRKVEMIILIIYYPSCSYAAQNRIDKGDSLFQSFPSLYWSLSIIDMIKAIKYPIIPPINIEKRNDVKYIFL